MKTDYTDLDMYIIKEKGDEYGTNWVTHTKQMQELRL